MDKGLTQDTEDKVVFVVVHSEARVGTQLVHSINLYYFHLLKKLFESVKCCTVIDCNKRLFYS